MDRHANILRVVVIAIATVVAGSPSHAAEDTPPCVCLSSICSKSCSDCVKLKNIELYLKACRAKFVADKWDLQLQRLNTLKVEVDRLVGNGSRPQLDSDLCQLGIVDVKSSTGLAKADFMIETNAVRHLLCLCGDAALCCESTQATISETLDELIELALTHSCDVQQLLRALRSQQVSLANLQAELQQTHCHLLPLKCSRLRDRICAVQKEIACTATALERARSAVRDQVTLQYEIYTLCSQAAIDGVSAAQTSDSQITARVAEYKQGLLDVTVVLDAMNAQIQRDGKVADANMRVRLAINTLCVLAGLPCR